MSTPTLPPFATVTGLIDDSAGELAEAFSRAVSRIHGGAQFTLIVEGKTVLDVAGGSVQTDTPVQVGPAQSRWVVVRVDIPYGSATAGSHPIWFEISAEAERIRVTEKSVFLVPR